MCSALPTARCDNASVSEEAWRPLGVDSDEDVAAYDALHDGVPEWIESAYWTWVRASLTKMATYPDGSGRISMLDIDLAESLCQTLKIPLVNLRMSVSSANASEQHFVAISTLKRHPHPLQLSDYLLAHGGRGSPQELDAVLERGKSAWTTGTRSGRPGLVRRVPLGVQVAADSIMERSGRAGARLAKAWEQVYGLSADASGAYRSAILAVEDAAVPVVSPTNPSATLGTILKQMVDQKNWSLPMEREHDEAPSGAVVVSMMRMLWHGQHDRHGGQPSAPGDVSIEEATVAVGLAVTLVQWFDAGLVQRR